MPSFWASLAPSVKLKDALAWSSIALFVREPSSSGGTSSTSAHRISRACVDWKVPSIRSSSEEAEGAVSRRGVVAIAKSWPSVDGSGSSLNASVFERQRGNGIVIWVREASSQRLDRVHAVGLERRTE